MSLSGVNLVWNLGVVDPGKKCDFSRQISEKSNFRPFHQRNRFSRQLQFFRKSQKEIWFSRQKWAIYSYFEANYSISLQKSPLSNIHVLPVHDKIIIIFHNPFTTPTTSPSTPTTPLPKFCRIDAPGVCPYPHLWLRAFFQHYGKTQKCVQYLSHSKLYTDLRLWICTPPKKKEDPSLNNRSASVGLIVLFQYSLVI